MLWKITKRTLYLCLNFWLSTSRLDSHWVENQWLEASHLRWTLWCRQRNEYELEFEMTSKIVFRKENRF